MEWEQFGKRVPKKYAEGYMRGLEKDKEIIDVAEEKVNKPKPKRNPRGRR